MAQGKTFTLSAGAYSLLRNALGSHSLSAFLLAQGRRWEEFIDDTLPEPKWEENLTEEENEARLDEWEKAKEEVFSSALAELEGAGLAPETY